MDNCPLRPVRRGRKSLRWTSELGSLRREVRPLFNRCQANNNSYSWELYRETQRRYRKEVRKASKETWRNFCTTISDLPRTARLHRDPKIRLGSLVAPSGERMQSEGETLDLLLATHFPNSLLWRGERYPPLPAVPNVQTGRWLRRLLPTEEWDGQLILLPHIKAQAWMGYSHLCCKRDGRSLFPTWPRSFVPAWLLDTFQPCGARLR